MRKIVYLLSAVLTLVSCKIKEEKSEEVDILQSAETKGFKVTLNVVSKTTDDFCLLYTEDGTINFGKTFVWTSVPGKREEQKVEFYLPKDVYPTELRFDLGLKQTKTDTIYLKSVHLEYNGKKLDIIGSELGRYFRADENHCKFDSNTGAVTPVVNDGIVKHPSIYPQEAILGPELAKLAK